MSLFHIYQIFLHPKVNFEKEEDKEHLRTCDSECKSLQWKGLECSNQRVNPTAVLYSSNIFVFLFVLEDKLYVIMELVEGAPLGEHFNSLKEKGTRFSEERIWHIFIQVPCLDFLLKIFILYRTF